MLGRSKTIDLLRAELPVIHYRLAFLGRILAQLRFEENTYCAFALPQVR